MAEAIYICCALVSTACAALLTKNYLRNRTRMLLWLAVSFGFLALNNIFSCFDLILYPNIEMWGALVRNLLFAISGTVLAVGLLWEIS